MNDETIMQWLLKHGPDPNTSKEGSLASTMHAACTVCPLSTIELLHQHGGLVTHGALQAAAKPPGTDRIPIMEFLLREGALIDELECEWNDDSFPSLDDPSPSRFSTALHHASSRDNLDVVMFLLANGARQDIEDHGGKTPVQRAQEKGHDRIVAILRQHQTGSMVADPFSQCRSKAS